jgi:hypothetical protein
VLLPNRARRQRLLARLKEAERLCAPGQSALDQWRLACTRLAASAFHTGQNGRGWRASFDFLLQPEQFAKALEDAFGGPAVEAGKGGSGGGGSARGHRRRTAAARAGQEVRLKKLLEAQLSDLSPSEPRQPSPQNPPLADRPNAGPEGEPAGSEGGTVRDPDAPAQTSIPPPKETPPDERTP